MNFASTYTIPLFLDAPLGRLSFPVERARTAQQTVDRSTADAVLIEGSLNGNERAFRILVERYQAHIVRTVTGMLGASPDVDDTVQEVFIRFHAAMASFRGQSSVKTFLTRIAINRCLDVIRSRKRKFFVPWEAEQAEAVVSDEPTPDLVSIQASEREQLRSAINSLSPRHKAVVVLRLIDGLSTAEAANVLKVPYGTVLSRLKRALAKLKDVLGDSLDITAEFSTTEDASENWT